MGGTTQVILITGFLGSGKTTFLNRIIKQFPRDRKLMILMNEFGEVGLDGTLVEGDDMDILEISKGSIFCVCVKTDFIRALSNIAQTLKPDVLIVESTGVANPSDLKKDLGLSIFRNRFQLEDQICILDADCFEDAFETFVSVEKQIASSSVFIINKIDLATPGKIQRIREIITSLNSSPEIIETCFADVPMERFIGSSLRETGTGSNALPVTDQELEAAIDALLDNPDPNTVPPDRLLSAVYAWTGRSLPEFMALVNAIPGGIIRAKGIVDLDEGLHLFNRVMARQTVKPYTSVRDCTKVRNMLVFIGPPEAVSDLETLTASMATVEKRSVLDPMQAR